MPKGVLFCIFQKEGHTWKNSEWVYEPRIIEEVDMPFFFDKQRVSSGEYIDNNSQFCEPNWHENIEVLYIISGKGIANVEFHEYEVEAGDIIVVGPNLIHQITTDTFVEYYYLIPDKDFLIGNGIDLDGLSFKEKIRDHEVARRWKVLISASRGVGKFSLAEMRAAIITLVAYIGQHYTKQSTQRLNAGTSIDYIKKAIDYIESNLKSKLSVDDIASKVGVSKYHFMREFKRLTTYTVIEYINLRRCNMAQIMLKNKENSISRICSRCGFETSAYFSRIFKKYVGMAPLKFREQIHKK